MSRGTKGAASHRVRPGAPVRTPFSTRVLPAEPVPSAAGSLRAVPDGLLTVREAARVLAVSTSTVYRLVSDALLPHIRVGNAIRVHTDDLAALRICGDR